MLDPNRLLEDAAAATKLSDFGDPSFREGLDRLVDSLNGEATLSPLGTAMAEAAMPGFRALHYDPPDAPTECVMLFNHAFDSSALWTTFFVPTYMA